MTQRAPSSHDAARWDWEPPPELARKLEHLWTARVRAHHAGAATTFEALRLRHLALLEKLVDLERKANLKPTDKRSHAR